MLLSCPKVHAAFPQENLHMGHEPPAWVRWNEHSGTFILRVAGLKLTDPAGSPREAGLALEVAVADAPALQEKIEGFAAHHHLLLKPPPHPPPELREQPLLAACHIPEKQLFVYCEGAELAARPTPEGNLELAVTGTFHTRRVPCQEGDLVIHLTPQSMGRLLSYFFTLAHSRV